jgi:hypothetical protein
MKKLTPMLGASFVDFQERARQKKAYEHEIPDECWTNDIYECFVYRGDKVPNKSDYEITWLSVKRKDRAPINNWRHLQQIKNDVCGKNYTAVEIYPSEKNLIDQANQYHLWVFTDGTELPFGWTGQRITATKEQAKKIGAKQR